MCKGGPNNAFHVIFVRCAHYETCNYQKLLKIGFQKQRNKRKTEHKTQNDSLYYDLLTMHANWHDHWPVKLPVRKPRESH